MPAGFEKCRKGGGEITTIKLSGGRYRHICTIRGKKFLGHIKKKKKK